MWPLLIQAGMGLIGQREAQRQQAKQSALLNEQLGRYDEIPLPVLEQMVAEQLGPSAFEGISADPALRQAQLDTLAKFTGLANTGFSAEEEADTSRMLSRINRNIGAQRGAIARQYGGSSPMAALATQLEGVQSQGANAYQTGMDLRAQNLARRFQALQAQGQMAGNIRGQDWQENSQKAAARDAIEKYNAAARQGAKNYNLQLAQQRFNNQLSLEQARGNAVTGAANMYGQQAQGTREMWAGLGGAAAQTAAAYAGTNANAQGNPAAAPAAPQIDLSSTNVAMPASTAQGLIAQQQPLTYEDYLAEDDEQYGGRR